MSAPAATPVRDARHDVLAPFLGRWRAEGESYGGPAQDPAHPRAAPERWESTHEGRWHTGGFFLIQDERAVVGGRPFDTLSVMGVDPATGRHFAHGFENHGFERRYDVAVDGRAWTLTGEHERARIVFSADGRTQTIAWEWRRDAAWLPLCDRVATRQDRG